MPKPAPQFETKSFSRYAKTGLRSRMTIYKTSGSGLADSVFVFSGNRDLRKDRNRTRPKAGGRVAGDRLLAGAENPAKMLVGVDFTDRG
jgi:hypothetical protein